MGLGKNTMLEAIEEVQAVKDAVKEPMENPHCLTYWSLYVSSIAIIRECQALHMQQVRARDAKTSPGSMRSSGL